MVRDYLKVGLRDATEACDTAGGYEDFARLIEDNVYDVILLDHGLPRVSGLEILYGIRSGEFACPYDIKVVMITGFTDLPIIKQAKAFDVDALIAKPFSIAQLTQKIAHVMQHEAAKTEVEAYRQRLRQQAEDACRAKRWPVSLVIPGKPLWYTAAELEKAHKRSEYVPVEVCFLRPGMRLAENFYSPSGQLLISQGIALTERLIAHLQLISPDQAVLILPD
jgi:CheY-like chemotaxis protein